jgi:hypothetical protein
VDLRLFTRVLWRFRLLLAAGCVVALVLSVMSVYKLPSLKPRTQPVYSSAATLFVTQSGFPWGSAIQQYAPSGSGNSTPNGDLGRLTTLANLYVQIVNSDVIKTRVLRREPTALGVSATQNYYTSPTLYSTPLPLLSISGMSTSKGGSVTTAQAGVAALDRYLKRQQIANRIPNTRRVVLQEIQPPSKVIVVNPTKKTLPVVVFLTLMFVFVGLAFVLENMRPGVQGAGVQAVALPEAEPPVGSSRRSA